MTCKCENINFLEGVDAEEYADSHLIKLASDGNTWEILYQCHPTKSYWLMYFPHSELHGGGPPALVKIDFKEAKVKFPKLLLRNF